MNKKQNAKDTQQPHSKAKVEFYGKYLKSYLRILCNTDFIKQINVYDVFCGRGIYDDGNKGSAITAFDIVKTLRNEKSKNYYTPITLFLNDIQKEYTDNIKTYIEKAKNSFCRVEYSNLDTVNILQNVFDKVSKTNNVTRNLIFIDPYGYKKISKEILFNIMKNGKTEIILFLPISQIQRFSRKAMTEKEKQSEEAQKYMPLIEFIESFFEENHDIRKQNKVNQLEYIQHISEALKSNNNYFATSYHIDRCNDVGAKNYFALFFMSSNIKGFEKILEVKWALDKENGQGFNETELQTNLFEEQNKQDIKEYHFKRLENALINKLSVPKNNKEVYEIVLRNEYLPKHAKVVFDKWQKEENNKFKVIDVKTKNNARKGSFYLKNKEIKTIFSLE